MTRGEAALAAGYFSFFGAVGIFQPYWPARLSALGMSAATIGVLLGIANGARIVGPLIAAWLADHSLDRRRLMVWLGGLSVLATAGLWVARAPVPMAVALAVYSLVFNALTPVFDAHALQSLGAGLHRYGRLRLWGSVGFVATTSIVGVLIERRGTVAIGPALGVMVVAMAILLRAAPRTPRPSADGASEAVGPETYRVMLQRPGVRRLLLISFLHLAGFGAYYGFYTLYLHAHGYGAATIGVYWAVGVLAEIAMFAVMPRVLARVPLETLLRVSLGATVLRWALVAACVDSRPVMLLTQLLHLAGFALFHSVTVLVGPRLVPTGAATRVLALMASAGWGAGGVAGSLIAGALWTLIGPWAAFAGATLLALMAYAMAVFAPQSRLPAQAAVVLGR